MPNPRLRAVAAAVALPALLALFVLPAASAERAETALEDARDWIASKDAYYQAHPELKTTPGSGWKPFNRIKWDYDQHVRADGTLPSASSRWRAWEDVQDRISGRPTPRAAWFQLGPENYGGRMLSISWDRTNTNIIYAGSAGGGLWKSTDAGTTWTPKTDHLMSLSVSGVAVSHTDPNIVVIVTGELPVGLVGGIHSIGILRSTDAGDTWGPTSLTHTRDELYGFHIVEAGPNGTFLAGDGKHQNLDTEEGLWRSSDDGVTWDLVKTGAEYYDVKWKPGSPNVVYAVKGDGAQGNNVKISTDDGLTWVKAGTGQPMSGLIGKSKIAVTAANPEYIYAVYANKVGDTTTGFYRSTDGGQTWSARNTTTNIVGAQGWYNLSIAADPNNAETIIAGGVRLYRSTNGAMTLSQTGGGQVHVDHHDARYEPGSDSNLWIACDGGIWHSTNDGQGGWVDHNNGLVTFQFYDVCVAQSDAERMAGGAQDQGVPVRTSVNVWDDGINWMDGMECVIDPANSDIIYAEGQFGALQKSTNGGISWTDIQNNMPSWEGLWVTPLSIDRNDGTHLYTMRGTADPGAYRTTNGGSNWTRVTTVAPQSISISPVDGNVVWLLPFRAEYTTDDGGSWTTCSAFPFDTGNIYRIEAHPTDVAAAFVTFFSYGEGRALVAYTTDFGVTWADVTGDLPALPIRDIAVDPLAPNQWYVGAEIGVFASMDGGTSWIPYAVGLPNAVVRGLEIQESSRKLVAATFGRGAWEVDITPPLSTDAPVVSAGSIDLKLDAPKPNPARGEVRFRWASRRPGAVSLTVYDVQGRLVSRVAERENGDGIVRHATWLLDDVAPGVYFAVLEAGLDRVSRKVVVVE